MNTENLGSRIRLSLADTCHIVCRGDLSTAGMSSELDALQSLTWSPSGFAFPCRTESWSHPCSLFRKPPSPSSKDGTSAGDACVSQQFFEDGSF